MTGEVVARVGIVGSGYISRHFVMAVERLKGISVSRVLTRRPLDSCGEFPARELLTDSLDEILEHSDVVLECAGDVIYATDVIDRALQAGLPVVTANPDFHATAGSYFVDRGLVTEAEGDQPGSEAALLEEVVEMGFEPLAICNMKGFQNHHPTPEEMRYWADRQGISVPMVTSFTDGTKLQVEQAIVANGLGADIAQPGLIGLETDDLREAAETLARRAEEIGRPISDYVLSRKLSHGVFVVAKHDPRQAPSLAYYKMGDGPYYVLQRPAVLCHLEIAKTIKRVVTQGSPLLNNSARPRISVASVAKRDLQPGERIDRGAGSFDVRGVAVRIAQNPGHLPIGLVQNAIVKRPVKAEDQLTFDDIEVPESLALQAWTEIETRARAGYDVNAGSQRASAT